MAKGKGKQPGKQGRSRSFRVGVMSLDEELRGAVGCLMRELVFDPKVGPEKYLVIFDESRIVDRLGKMPGMGFFLKAGVGGTAHGPVGYFVFGFTEGDALLAAYRRLADPHHPGNLRFLVELADGPCVPVALVATDGKDIVHVMEAGRMPSFINAVGAMMAASQVSERGDYEQAKREFGERHSIEELATVGKQHFARVANTGWDVYRYPRGQGEDECPP